MIVTPSLAGTTPVRVATGATPRDMVRRMALAGLAVGAPVGLVVTLGWLFVSEFAALSSAIGALGAMVFAGVGHLVQWRFAHADPKVLLTVELVSYGLRVGLFGVALALYVAVGNPGQLHSTALVVGCVAVVLTWLVAEVVAGARLRILSFDEPAEEVTR